MKKKTAIITGSAQGIGKIIAMTMVHEGYNVAVIDNDQEALNEVKSEFDPSSSVFFLCDVSEEQQVRNMIEKTFTAFGRIDCVINNVAISANVPAEFLDLKDWNRVLAVNLTGSFLCSRHAIEYLRITKGCIINIASTRAFMSEPSTEAYSASKGGIVALTHALAVSLGPDIRVNCISPGWIEVSQYKKQSERKNPELTEADHSQHPAGRVGEARDIARMVIFLADPANGFITGQNFTVDGGMTKKMIYI